MSRVVIVGAGHAGCQMAASLRQEGCDGAVTLLGDEPGLPYQRPPLSKAYMKDGRADRLALRPESFFDQNGIVRLEGVTATRIDRDARRVETSDGAGHAYDHLVLATGGRNATPPIGGLGLAGVHELRTLAHAATLRSRLETMRRVVVVGGGFIGLEFAAVARSFGIEVIVAEAADRLMSRVVSPEISRIFLDAHRAAGAEILLGAFAAEVLDDGKGRAGGVRLADDRIVEGDAVLIAAGARPNVELAQDAGLAIDNGVAVDPLLLTDDPAISAIGDCASFPAPGTGRRVRLESVQAATDHARAVARRLAGHPAPYETTAWFWSDQGPLKLQIAGLGAGAQVQIVASDAGKTVVFCLAEDALVAVETINAPGYHMAARKLLGLKRTVGAAEIRNAEGDVRRLLATVP